MWIDKIIADKVKIVSKYDKSIVTYTDGLLSLHNELALTLKQIYDEYSDENVLRDPQIEAAFACICLLAVPVSVVVDPSTPKSVEAFSISNVVSQAAISLSNRKSEIRMSMKVDMSYIIDLESLPLTIPFELRAYKPLSCQITYNEHSVTLVVAVIEKEKYSRKHPGHGADYIYIQTDRSGGLKSSFFCQMYIGEDNKSRFTPYSLEENLVSNLDIEESTNIYGFCLCMLDICLESPDNIEVTDGPVREKGFTDKVKAKNSLRVANQPYSLFKNKKIRFTERSSYETKKHVESHRKITHEFGVKGHWRNQAYGPGNKLRKLIFIQGFIKGKDTGVRRIDKKVVTHE